MKILILSCSTGEGHNSAARAIEEELISSDIDCVIKDPVSFKSKRTEHLVASCYNNIIKVAPSAFGVIYKAGEWYDSTKMGSPIYFANSLYAEELFKYIDENRFDAVVATHLYGMEALTAIKKKLGKNVRAYGVMTDYTVTPFFCDTELDGYFAPHEDIENELLKKGFSREKIYSTGIPVSSKFSLDISRTDARKELGIPIDKKVFVVMSGGIGGGNVMGLCDDLVNSADENTLIYVLVGKNTRRQEKLKDRYGANSNVIIVPFTRKVNLYMKSADVLLSKPGGLSSTEAAVAEVPIIHINAIPGCESENVKFFASHEMSIAAASTFEAAQMAIAISNDEERSDKMRLMQRSLINKNAAKDIVRIITS